MASMIPSKILMMTNLSIGFSIIAAILLFITYAFFIKSSNKSFMSVLCCGIFLVALTYLQIEHLSFLFEGGEPLESKMYRFVLLLVPALFYFFSRYVLFINYKFRPISIIHFTPLISVFMFPQNITIPLAFVIGSGYCLWLSKIILDLKEHRKLFEVEFFFMVFFSVFAIGVLAFGFSVTYIDSAYFYYFYANGIGLAYVLVTSALIIYPDLLNELTAAVKLSYSKSTLTGLNIKEQMSILNGLNDRI